MIVCILNRAPQNQTLINLCKNLISYKKCISKSKEGMDYSLCGLGAFSSESGGKN